METFAYSLIGAGIVYGLQRSLLAILEDLNHESNVRNIQLQVDLNQQQENDEDRFLDYDEWEIEEFLDILTTFSRHSISNSSEGDGLVPSRQDSILRKAQLERDTKHKKAKNIKKTTLTSLTSNLNKKAPFRQWSEPRQRTRSRSPIRKQLTPGP